MPKNMESKVEELGLTVDDFYGNQPRLKAKRCNVKLKIYREFVLATLSSLARDGSKSLDKFNPIRACDAISGCGITGLQWKKHLKHQVHVTLAEQEDLTKLKSNAFANDLEATDIQLDGRRTPGDPYPKQSPTEVHSCCADAKALLVMESFQFIFLNPLKTCASFIDPALQNVNNGGIVCLVVPDTSVFVRAPHVVQRCYSADVIKTEYLKELAARIVLASIARAAARCNKGIRPLYVVAKEDFLLISVQVLRGNKVSDSSLGEITRLLHCRLCEERIFIEHQLAPDENPYSKLACQCKEKNTGKTAVLIGPMWKGPIFNSVFLKRLQINSKDLPLSTSFHEYLSLLVAESTCLPSHQLSQAQPNASNRDNVQYSQSSAINEANSLTKKNDVSQTETYDDFSNSHSPNSSVLIVEESKSQTCGKRKGNCDIEDRLRDVKKCKTATNTICGNDLQVTSREDIVVPFYYPIRKCRTSTLPKLDQCVNLLQKAGFLASRTHFDPCSIRTSATVEQFLAALR